MATIIPALPYTLTNGTVADANQVMGDLNAIVSSVNGAGAHNGPNADITSLSGLTTPLSVAQGGTGANTPTGALTDLGAMPIVGVIDGSNAVAGNVGEYLTATQASAGVSNASALSLVSLALTAGDWDVWGQASTLGGATACTAFIVGIGTALNTFGSLTTSLVLTSATIGAGTSLPAPRIRVSISAGATFYVTVQCNFTPGVVNCSATIFARRVR